MVQKKLPLINSAHGSETRNIINELIKLFNGMGYTYEEALQKAHNVLNEAQQTNDMNVDVQQQIDNVLKGVADPTSEIAQARGPFELLNQRLEDTENRFNGLETNVSYHGIFPDGNDYTNELRLLISKYDSLVFPEGKYNITDELLFKHGQSIRTVGQVIFDGSSFVGENGDSVVKVTNVGSPYSALPNLTHDIVAGARTLTFSSSHNLETDDVICLYDNTRFSWSNERSEYKKGEYCRVTDVVSTTTVLLDSPIFDDYESKTNTEFGVYKMNMGTFNIFGNLKVIQGKPGRYHGLVVERVRDFSAEKIIALSQNGSYSAIQLRECFNPNFSGIGIHEKLSGLGADYGLFIHNCQHVNAEGYFSGARHGVTTGGGDGPGRIINRDINVKGTVKNSGEGNRPAFDTHGNTQYAHMDGTVYGGVAIAGSNVKVSGTVYSNKDGICVSFAFLRSFDHDLSGATFISYGNPRTISRGVIDFGGAGTASELNNMLGGTINMQGIKLEAPKAENGLLFRTRNEIFDSNEKLNILMNNASVNLKENPDAGAAMWIEKTGTNAQRFNKIDYSGMKLNEGNIVINQDHADTLLTNDQSGTQSVSLTSATNSVELTINFPQVFPSNYSPNISVSLYGGQSIGGEPFNHKISYITRYNFRVLISTESGANFPTTTEKMLTWHAN